MKEYKIIIPGSQGNTINWHETDSFPTALKGASAMGGLVQRNSDGWYYQDETPEGQIWTPSLLAVQAYHGHFDEVSAEVDAIIEQLPRDLPGFGGVA